MRASFEPVELHQPFANGSEGWVIKVWKGDGDATDPCPAGPDCYSSEEPMELFKRFRGREPQIDALLRHSGIAA